MNKILGWASALMVLVLGGALVAWLLLSGSGEQGYGAWPATKVALTKVERVDAPRTLYAVGELEAANQVILASETSGRITKIAFISGQQVKAGQLLVQLNDEPEQAQRQRLRAQLRNAKAVMERTRRLLDKKITTQEQVDSTTAAHDMALGELQQIEALITQQAIRAPFDGVIGILRVNEGQYLQAGDTIASLIDASVLYVNFSLEEQAIGSIQEKQSVQVLVDAWPERVFLSEITAIDPLIDSSSRTVSVQAKLANTEGLLQAGMFTSIRVLPLNKTPVLVVPEIAVTYTSYGQTVFVAKVGEWDALSVQQVAVKTGERWQGLVEIESGLEEGDQVVVSGQMKLRDGMQVEPLEKDSLHEIH